MDTRNLLSDILILEFSSINFYYLEIVLENLNEEEKHTVLSKNSRKDLKMQKLNKSY